METLSFEKNWANSKNDLVDTRRTKNGQNAPSCTGLEENKEAHVLNIKENETCDEESNNPHNLTNLLKINDFEKSTTP